MTALQRQAGALGIEPAWRDNDGVDHAVPQATLQALVGAMGERPAGTPPMLAEPGKRAVVECGEIGQPYRLIGEDGGVIEGRIAGWRGRAVLDARPPMGLFELLLEDQRHHLLVAPKRCLAPADLGIERCFGVTAQLYALRGRKPSDMGDLGHLPEAVATLGREGADFLGLNPLHALFSADPAACSPYSPSNRRFLCTLYVDPVAAAHDLGMAPPAMAMPSTGELIDYPAAAARRVAALGEIFGALERQGNHLELAAFAAAGGGALRLHAQFEAMHAAALARDPKRWAFWQWPAGWGRPGTPEALAFAREHVREIDFHVFLQWLADRQLARAQAEAREAGMRIGLYRDLAVGVNPAGSMVWSSPGLALRGVSIGAPPDAFSPLGQVWGLAPLAPNALSAAGFQPLLADLDANARHAGALRIDHVIGLQRQFWVPDGMEAPQGAYVRYPFEIVARLAALVSHRRRCLIIGEDLGTVPPGFRRRMQSFGMLSCRVLWFEREGSRPRPPERYPAGALASISTHDLPTVEGFACGRDIDWRERLGLFQDAQAAIRARRERTREKARLAGAMADAGIADADLGVGLHRFLGRTRSALAAVQLEDLDGSVEQVNLPGTVDTHPNWRRRLARPLAEVIDSPRAKAILRTMREERPR